MFQNLYVIWIAISTSLDYQSILNTPNIFRLVHLSEFRDEVDEYSFPNTSYPWEFFRRSFTELGEPSFQENRALLIEEDDMDDSFFDPNFGKLSKDNENILKPEILFQLTTISNIQPSAILYFNSC